jgi:hypothetical protein
VNSSGDVPSTPTTSPSRWIKPQREFDDRCGGAGAPKFGYHPIHDGIVAGDRQHRGCSRRRSTDLMGISQRGVGLLVRHSPLVRRLSFIVPAPEL